LRCILSIISKTAGKFLDTIGPLATQPSDANSPKNVKQFLIFIASPMFFLLLRQGRTCIEQERHDLFCRYHNHPPETERRASAARRELTQASSQEASSRGYCHRVRCQPLLGSARRFTNKFGHSLVAQRPYEGEPVFSRYEDYRKIYPRPSTHASSHFG